MSRNLTIFISIAVLIVAITLAWFLFFRGPGPIKNYPPANPSGEIVAFGDSLVEGVGSTEGKDLVSLLSAELGKPIINFGRSGDTTESALNRTQEIFKEVSNPKVAIILLGGNDFLRKVPKEETFKNLGIIIDEFQKRGAVVLLLGIRGGVLSDSFEEEFEIIQKTYQTAYVPNVLKGLLGDSRYMYDSIHPNSAGYQKIAEKVVPTLKMLSE
ncbi:MAG: GDSL-type esterase/lipase family protein [Patescibacteria group bacterium]